MKIEDFDIIEANEAFAAQSVAVGKELGIDVDKPVSYTHLDVYKRQALICAPRFGIDFVWLAVPAGWLANFLVSYAALRKSWPGEKVEPSRIFS